MSQFNTAGRGRGRGRTAFCLFVPVATWKDSVSQCRK
jgi:hypothetical protein